MSDSRNCPTAVSSAITDLVGFEASGTLVDTDGIGTLLVVGPNNSGKSLLLREIWTQLQLGERDTSTIPHILSNLVLRNTDDKTLTDWFQKSRPVQSHPSHGHQFFTGHHSITARQIPQQAKGWASGRMGNLAQHLVAYLDTDTRLQPIQFPNKRALGSDVAANSAIESLVADENLLEQLEADTISTFGLHLVIDALFNHIVLRVSVGKFKKPKEIFSEKTLIPTKSATDAYAELPDLNSQGDGMRAFVNIWLQLFAGLRPIAIIDEPEAFMHPATAYYLGSKLSASPTQALVSTHSSNILRGVLSASQTELRILRLGRTENGGSAHVLDASDLDHLVNDPVLRHSNALEGLFHHAVLVVEGAGDAAFYRAALDEIPKDAGDFTNRDILIVAANDKLRVAHVVAAMNKLQIPVAPIFDFDVLNQEKPLKETLAALGTEQDSQTKIETLRNRVDKAIRDQSQERDAQAIVDELASIPNDLAKPLVSADRRKMKAVIASRTWDGPKAIGLPAVPTGDAYTAASELLSLLDDEGVFVVESGDLESFDRSATQANKQKWLSCALENESHKSIEVREFLTKACKHILPSSSAK